MSTLIGNGAKNDAHAYSDTMVTMGPVGFYGQAVVLIIQDISHRIRDQEWLASFPGSLFKKWGTERAW